MAPYEATAALTLAHLDWIARPNALSAVHAPRFIILSDRTEIREFDKRNPRRTQHANLYDMPWRASPHSRHEFGSAPQHSPPLASAPRHRAGYVSNLAGAGSRRYVA